MARTKLHRAQQILNALQTHMNEQITMAEDLAAANRFDDAIRVLKQTTNDSKNKIWDAEEAFHIQKPTRYALFLKKLDAQLNAIHQLDAVLLEKIEAFAAMTPVVSVVIDTHSDELILDSVAELESDAHKFEMAKSNLQKLLDQPYPEINDLIKNFLIHVQELEDKAKSKKSKNESTVELTAAMNHTYRALTDPTFREEFHLIAKDMEGHASTRMKVIAGIMLALSVAILTLSIVFAPALAGLAPLLFITGKAIGITVGLTGGALAVGGFTFFAKSGESGLAKTAHKINKELINDSVVYNSTAPAA